MAQSSLLSLPISFITAMISFVILFLIIRSSAGNQASRLCFALLFASFALQAILIGLRFGYGVTMVTPLQRALPFTVGPLAYFGFRALIDPDVLKSSIMRCHTGAALLLISFCLILPLATEPEDVPAFFHGLIDLLITASYVVYLLLLTMLFRNGPDVFEATQFETVARTRRWLLATILVLAGLVVLDTIIALDFMLYAGHQAPLLVTFGHVLIIPTLAAAAFFYPHTRWSGSSSAASSRTPVSETEASADRSLIEAINQLLDERKLYRDPDLNLSRLARRLSVPSRRVSEAINRELGLNVSQFINNYRIHESIKGLKESHAPIGDVMQEAGFRTKSNFNREFKRVTGESPQAYRHHHGARGEADGLKK